MPPCCVVVPISEGLPSPRSPPHEGQFPSSIFIPAEIDHRRNSPTSISVRHETPPPPFALPLKSTRGGGIPLHPSPSSEINHMRGHSPSSVFVPAEINHRRGNYPSTICKLCWPKLTTGRRNSPSSFCVGAEIVVRPQERYYPPSSTPGAGSSAPPFALAPKSTPLRVAIPVPTR